MCDLSHILHTSLEMFDNDASRCYDHIVIALSTIMALHLGIPRAACCMHVMALALMKYFVKTIHSISVVSYQSTQSYHLFGTRQGSASGGSPPYGYPLWWCYYQHSLPWHQLLCTLLIHGKIYSPNEIQTPTLMIPPSESMMLHMTSHYIGLRCLH
jgi:hypothetical protein